MHASSWSRGCNFFANGYETINPPCPVTLQRLQLHVKFQQQLPSGREEVADSYAKVIATCRNRRSLSVIPLAAHRTELLVAELHRQRSLSILLR